MSTQRLFGIIYHLLNNPKSTTAELAETFEVSTRTISRDINTLSGVGVPIYTETGRNGGIYLLNNFILDKVLLSKEEQNNLLRALKGIRQIDPLSDQSFSKLQSLFKHSFDDWLEIDFTTWHPQSDRDTKFESLKTSILNKQQIEFNYINKNGQTKRLCHPYKLIFRSQAWYLQAFDLTQKAFRIFKINRINSIKILDQHFFPVVAPTTSDIKLKSETITTVLKFNEDVLYRVYDEFNHTDIKVGDDHMVTVKTELPDEEWVVSYLLSFGKHIKILSPDNLKQRMCQELKEVYTNILN